jgi:hypothetical protein
MDQSEWVKVRSIISAEISALRDHLDEEITDIREEIRILGLRSDRLETGRSAQDE